MDSKALEQVRELTSQLQEARSPREKFDVGARLVESAKELDFGSRHGGLAGIPMAGAAHPRPEPGRGMGTPKP